MNTPVLSIVGSSNSGKTTFMEKLVARLAAKGLRIATIKHSHHQPELDTPGKDSWRHKKAGAVTSFLVGPEQMMMVADIREQVTPNQFTPSQLVPTQIASRYCDDFDLVLAEGYNALPGAKIEVLRKERSTTLRCTTEDLVAVVTDVNDLNVSVPVFGLNDDLAVAIFVEDWFASACR